MKAREFGTGRPYNVFGPTRQKLYDPYNRSFKKERPEQPKEYYSAGTEEYYHVPELKDMSGSPYEEYQDVLSNISKKKNDTKSNSMRRQNLLRSVVGVVVGATVVVTTYQAMAEREQAKEPIPIVEPVEETDEPGTAEPVPAVPVLTPTYVWSDDLQMVTVKLSDESGAVVREIPATVTISDEEATCTKEGERTYTAEAVDEGKTYSDVKTEILPILGHEFADPVTTVLDNGQIVIDTECTRCHEHFTLESSVTETD